MRKFNWKYDLLCFIVCVFILVIYITEVKLPDKNDFEYASIEDVPIIKTEGTDCSALEKGNLDSISTAKRYQALCNKTLLSNSEYISMTSDCQYFKKKRKYILKPVSAEEADFGIAYSLLVFKNVEQVERLLRAIYRPQNVYCIHVDSKSDILPAISAIANCFNNVFIASQMINVKWGHYSVLEPELVCMEDLWKHKEKWKYFINLTGQEFPLKTNLDLVRILNAYQGANDVSGTITQSLTKRTKWVYKGTARTSTRKSAPSSKITLTKGSVHVALKNGFVDYILHNKDALMFRKWVKDTGVPDETFFSSLNHSPQLRAPGAYLENPNKKPSLTRFKNWGNWICAGKYVRGICIFDVGDIQQLAGRHEMFANKFYLDKQPLAYSCMEEMHYNRTLNEIAGGRNFNASFYTTFDFVKNHVA